MALRHLRLPGADIVARFFTLWMLISVALASSVQARTLEVGGDKEFKVPSAAAAVAKDGDRIEIQPGQYYDCAIWRANALVIEGVGQPNTVVVTDTTCQGKALFVVTGNDVTIRGLTLARARVPDGNGAGIRLEGQGLTLERVRFENDEAGLLSGVAGAAAIRISNCDFEDGGVGGDRPTFAVSVGAVRLLRIEGSRFDRVKGGQIATSADRTELDGDTIDAGTGEAPAVAVQFMGGGLVMQDDTLTIGPNAPRLAGAVLTTGEGTIELRRDRLENKTGQALALLLNWSGTDPVLLDNHVGQGDEVVSTSGLWRHRASLAYHGTKDSLHAFASWIKGRVRGLLGR